MNRNVKVHTKPKPKLLQRSLEEYYFTQMSEKAEQNYESIFKNIAYAPATEVSQARREIACLNNKLVKAREKWVEDKKGINARWKDATQRYKDIYENLPKFNGYYKDSFAKRERSMRLYQREREQCIHKDKEIRRLNRELDKLTETRTEVENRLDKFSVFKAYLSKVKETSQGEYTDIREIIDRYSILAEARTNLGDKNMTTRDTINRRQKALDNDILTKSNEVLAYRNYLSELLEYHTSLQEQVQSLDDNLLRIKTTAAQRTMIIGQIKMSIDNLYRQVCKHMHRFSKLGPEDSLGQLADIGISVREMSKLSKDIKHMLKAAYVAAEAEKTARDKAIKKALERQKRVEKLTNTGKIDVRELFELPPLLKTNSKIDLSRLLANALTTTTANVTN